MLGVFVRAQSLLSHMQEEAREERGATAVEYGLLVALIAVVIILVVGQVGSKVSSAFSSVNAIYP
jgi:pilus assembly protein Flp/PilA